MKLIKYIILILLLASPVSAAGLGMTIVAGGGGSAVLSCQVGLTQSANNTTEEVGRSATNSGCGEILTMATTKDICKVTFYLSVNKTTTLDGLTMYARIFNTTGGNDTTTLVASSTGITCTSGSCDSYSCTPVDFTFASNVTVTGTTAYAYMVDLGSGYNSDNHLKLCDINSDVLAGGNLLKAQWYNSNPGYVISAGSYDAAFKLWWPQ
jgi:hypothetical protein